MSSFKMHVAISKKVKEDLNYGDLFILGAILPDIIKLILGERESSHFETNSEIDLDKYLLTQDNIKSELALGYYAHLIEDKIWFELYMEKYTKLKEYSDDKLYNDYAFVDDFMYRKLNMSTEDIRKILLENVDKIDIKTIKLMNCKNESLINNRIIKEKIKEVWKDYECDNNNYFYTIEDAEEYYKIAIEKVKKYINKLK